MDDNYTRYTGGAINYYDFKPKLQKDTPNLFLADDEFLTLKAPEFQPFWGSWYHEFKQRGKKGRPENSPTKYRFDSEEFTKMIHEAKISIEDAGEYPSQERVAELLGIEGAKAIQRLCYRFKVKYKDI